MCSVQLIFFVLRHNPHFKGFQSCDVLLSQSPYFCTVQCRTSNQCFHHSFLEASSYFSILPLVIHSSWKRLLSYCYPGASILGAEGCLKKSKFSEICLENSIFFCKIA